jgi:hypothetical protein
VKTIGALADRLLQLVMPKAEADAGNCWPTNIPCGPGGLGTRYNCADGSSYCQR